MHRRRDYRTRDLVGQVWRQVCTPGFSASSHGMVWDFCDEHCFFFWTHAQECMAHYLVSQSTFPSESVVNSESGGSLERSLVFASARNRLLASCTQQFFLYLHTSSQIMYVLDVSISMHFSIHRFENTRGQYPGNESPRKFGELPTRDSLHSISPHSSPENKISSKTKINTRAFAVPSKISKEFPMRRLWARNPQSSSIYTLMMLNHTGSIAALIHLPHSSYLKYL